MNILENFIKKEKKVKFSRESTLDEDIMELLKKWRGDIKANFVVSHHIKKIVDTIAPSENLKLFRAFTAFDEEIKRK